ncbi:unnamed protein product [Caenorhabditis bovis]|uniref:Uncharacterized protein n=1 Tax=Caenorhabditis bovis TaxID=2654633 RepID=A0A8S1FAC8_9PELO|nr:unnamed protein product [Caenorhabditis bovis]
MFAILLLIFPMLAFSDYCGDHKIPYGVEVHKNGKLRLLCTRPNCHEKKYAECPERADQQSCTSNSSWVGGLEQNADGELTLRCCEYDLLSEYATIQFMDLPIHAGEYFEGEEKMDGDAVVEFDLIGNIVPKIDENGTSYLLTVYRYHCGDIPDAPPNWYIPNQWPYFK